MTRTVVTLVLLAVVVGALAGFGLGRVSGGLSSTGTELAFAVTPTVRSGDEISRATFTPPAVTETPLSSPPPRPSATATATETPTPTATVTATATTPATVTPSATPTPSPTATPTKEPTATATQRPSPAATERPSPTATQRPRPTPSPTSLLGSGDSEADDIGESILDELDGFDDPIFDPLLDPTETP